MLLIYSIIFRRSIPGPWFVFELFTRGLLIVVVVVGVVVVVVMIVVVVVVVVVVVERREENDLELFGKEQGDDPICHQRWNIISINIGVNFMEYYLNKHRCKRKKPSTGRDIKVSTHLNPFNKLERLKQRDIHFTLDIKIIK